MNVLVVDDEPALRQLIRRFLDRDFDVNILEADDGLSALDRLLNDQVDLVLLDLSMRVMGGIETLEAIRRSGTYANLPVVLMTGQADEQHVRRAIELGIEGFILKPFTPASLRERLAGLIGARQSSERSGLHPPRALDIDPLHRALIVDQSPEFRAIVARQLGRLCHVEEAGNEFIAMKRCLSGTFNLLLIGSTSELSTAASLAKKVRDTAELRRMRLAAAVPPGEFEPMKTLGVFDAVLARSFVEDTFDSSLHKALSQDTLARLLLHPTSKCVADLFAQMGRGLAPWMGGAVTLHETPQYPPGEPRWAVVAVEIQAGRQAWDLVVRCTIAMALEIASARQHGDTGKISEEQAMAAIGQVVEGFAEEFRPLLLEHGLTSRVFPARVTVLAAGAGSAKARGAGIRRWFVSPRQLVVPVELAPLLMRDQESTNPARSTFTTRPLSTAGVPSP